MDSSDVSGPFAHMARPSKGLAACSVTVLTTPSPHTIESDDLPDSNGIDKPEGLRSSVWCQCLHRRVCREAQRFAGQGGQGCTGMVRVLGADSQGQGWSLWVRVGEVRVMRSHGYGLTVTFPGSGVRGVIRAGEPATQTPGPIVLLPLADPCGPHGAVPGCRLPSKPG